MYYKLHRLWSLNDTKNDLLWISDTGSSINNDIFIVSQITNDILNSLK